MSLSEIVLVGLGAGLLVVGLVWRVVARRWAERDIRRALTHQDAFVRAAAVTLVGQRGLAPFAELLAQRLRDERDPTVVRELVTLVARHQWEPLDSRTLVGLRLDAVRTLQQDARLHAMIAPGEQITAWGERGEVVGDAGSVRGRELAAAVEAAVDEEVRSLKLVEDDGEILLVECEATRGAAACTPSAARVGPLSRRLREAVEEPRWA